MKDNKQFIANSPYEGNGTSYFQMMNDNSISKEDRILNKDIIYLKPASNYTKLLKTDENYLPTSTSMLFVATSSDGYIHTYYRSGD